MKSFLPRSNPEQEDLFTVQETFPPCTLCGHTKRFHCKWVHMNCWFGILPEQSVWEAMIAAGRCPALGHSLDDPADEDNADVRKWIGTC